MWRCVNVNDKEEICKEIGPLTARISRNAACWNVSLSGMSSQDFSCSIISPGNTVCFKPVLPVRPFLGVLAEKFFLAPEAEVCFKLVLVPDLQMEIGRHAKTAIQAVPLKSFFEGPDTINGELCSLLPGAPEMLYTGSIEDNRAGASLAEAEKAGPSLSVFTEAIIRNRSKQVYEFERIVIYPETIDIFEKNGALVGDLVIIDYLESGEFRLQTPPVVPKGYTIITPGIRDGMNARFFRHGAGLFKDLTSMKLS
jgi:hypothetical protein